MSPLAATPAQLSVPHNPRRPTHRAQCDGLPCFQAFDCINDLRDI